MSKTTLINNCCWVCKEYDVSGGQEFGHRCDGGWSETFINDK